MGPYIPVWEKGRRECTVVNRVLYGFMSSNQIIDAKSDKGILFLLHESLTLYNEIIINCLINALSSRSTPYVEV